MNKYFFLLLLGLFSLGCGEDAIVPPEEEVENPPPPPSFELPTVEDKGFNYTDEDLADWTMIWDEDFSTDLGLWDVWNGGAFNNELQIYKEANLYVENDFLYIRHKRESSSGFTNPFDNTIKSFTHSSGRIESKERFSPSSNGGTVRYMARIKLPAGEGLWPAFWSYDDPWPTKGEIDVMEFRGGETDRYKTNFFYGEAPNQVLTNSSVQSRFVIADSPLTDEFHVYELEWTQDELIMILDGEVQNVYNVDEFQYVDDMYDKDQNLVLNLAIGGDFFSNLDPGTIPSESYMIVDWVKVFRK